MAVKKRKRKQNYSVTLTPAVIGIIAVIAVVLITVSSFHHISFIPTWGEIGDYALDYIGSLSEDNLSPKPTVASGTVEVHFIDVGQGDSILIRTPQKNVLIDAGENNQGETVVNYLKKQNISSLDIVIGTHPHSDHIGGMDVVIDNMNVNKVIMPKLPDRLIPTTRSYRDVLESIANKNLKITSPEPYTEYDLGNGARLTILAPFEDFDELNNMSIVSRLDFGKTSFLFTGDIEKEAEKSLLNNLRNISILDVDVYDTPHHGSGGSSHKAFLEAVSPEYAVISCGKDNDYGHPHKDAVERILKFTEEIHRTDLESSVVIISDGKDYLFKN